jgi:precorrin-8X/cobalt-precorrin-8 methylmutase
LEDYIKDPHEIEKKSFEIIREATDLSGFTEIQQQVVMRLVHTSGNPDVAQQVRFSANAINVGIEALNQNHAILCDVEMVKQGLTKRFLTQQPLCFLNHEDTPKIASASGETRTMSALELWTPYLENSIVIIGNAPTALFRLMEMLEAGSVKPTLIIGMPVGFVGAPESKDYLWNHHQNLGIECITLKGRFGGSALAAGVFNTLVRLKNGLQF